MAAHGAMYAGILHQEQLRVSTRGLGLYEITAEVARVVRASGLSAGTCTVFIRHTSASLFIQENAAPEVAKDALRFLANIAPETDTYAHDDEGPDDMPAHLRSMITRTSEVIPVSEGAMVLGTWQGIFVAEHRRAPHEREVFVHVMGR